MEQPTGAEAKAAARPGYIPTLDGWRALAVTIVMGAHSYGTLLKSSSKPARMLGAFFSHAGYGVDIFFGLSGFLICTLLLREKERTGTISLGRFYVRRVFRILPPLFLYMACILTLSYLRVIPHLGRREVLAVFFFFRNYIDAGWYTMHLWSLAVEEHFYAVVPLFLLLLKRKRAIWGTLLLIVLCIGIRWFEFSHAPLSAPVIEFRTENRLDGLLWGVVLALAMHSRGGLDWLRKWSNGWVTLIVVGCAGVMLTVFQSQPIHRTVVAAAIPVLLGYTVLHAEGLAGRFLEWPLLTWIGRLSYSLYLWQMLFLTNRTRDLGALQSFPMALVYPFICAALSYYLLEKPMVRLGHRLAGSPTARRAARQL